MSAQPVTLELLRSRFVSGFERRLETLDALLTALAAATDDGEAAHIGGEINRAFHSLAGIGGTFGFHDVTRLAREGEGATQCIWSCPAADEVAMIKGVVMALRESFENASG